MSALLLGCRRRRQSISAQRAEMVDLEALQRRRALTAEESERLGQLIYREQQRARYRPERIRRLRAELELLESLEAAERGAAAIVEEAPRALELVRDADGCWQREAA